MKPPVYNTIGTGYNSFRKADPYLAGRLEFLLQAEKGKNYLDIGCGTGNYTHVLSEKEFTFYGVDPSEKMLENARNLYPETEWKNGSSENIPFANGFFDGGIATLTLHHWHDLPKGMQEISRVLKTNARFIIFTSDPEQMKGYWLNHYFSKMLNDSIRQMPAIDKVESALTNSGFEMLLTEKYFVRDDLRDLFLYAGKNRPELYFDENVRRGISSFSALSNTEEVNTGLAQLRSDIDTGIFPGIKSQYENEKGDYLFILAEKKF